MAEKKYDVMSAVMADYLKNGRLQGYDERTWLDMLIVKHTLITADKMKFEGDSISEMTDGESSSSYVRWITMTTLEDFSCITERETFGTGFIFVTRIMAEMMQGLEQVEDI